MRTQLAAILLTLGMIGAAFAAEPGNEKGPTRPAEIKDIKAYCLDFNWGGRRQFARPGNWKNADPLSP